MGSASVIYLGDQVECVSRSLPNPTPVRGTVVRLEVPHRDGSRGLEIRVPGYNFPVRVRYDEVRHG